MMTRCAAMVGALVAIVSVAYGIDRGAERIDSLTFESAAFDKSDTIRGIAATEMAVGGEAESLALVAEAGLGSLSQDQSGDGSLWEAGIGVKYYIDASSSVAFLGGFRRYDLEADPKETSLSLRLAHRFLPAEEAVSPYVKAEASVLFPDSDTADDIGDVFTARVGVGCELMLREDFAFAFEGMYCESEDVVAGPVEYNDGWILKVGMRYYWE